VVKLLCVKGSAFNCTQPSAKRLTIHVINLYFSCVFLISIALKDCHLKSHIYINSGLHEPSFLIGQNAHKEGNQVYRYFIAQAFDVVYKQSNWLAIALW